MRRGAGERGQTAAAPYLEAARRAAGFLRERMWSAGSRTLLRRFRDGHAEIEAYAEDYACLIFGLLELFQTDVDPVWLEWAIALQERQDELFWDEAGGGWFSTTGRDPSVLLRMKEEYDGAEPTASSVSVLNLLVLSHLVDDARWADRIERTLRLFGTRLEQIFGMFGQEAKGETCEGIKGLIKEAEDLLDEDADEPISDAGLIASAQKAEHYEIAGYGTLRTWAGLLGRNDAAQLLEFTLDEEKKADQKLTDIARRLNVRAAGVRSK